MTETNGTGRIRWEPTEYGGFTGHVGTRPETDWLFQIWSAASVGGDWQLDSTLPGQFGSHSRADDPATLKADAEFLLAEFVSSLGAIFPAEPAADPGREDEEPEPDWRFEWELVGRTCGESGDAVLKHKSTAGRYRIIHEEDL